MTVVADNGDAISFEVQQQAACEIAGTTDCDGDGVIDLCAILWDLQVDDDGNGVPDVCEEVEGDFNLDGVVDGADLSILLAMWGDDQAGAVDLTGDGRIDGADLSVLLSRWQGP